MEKNDTRQKGKPAKKNKPDMPFNASLMTALEPVAKKIRESEKKKETPPKPVEKVPSFSKNIPDEDLFAAEVADVKPYTPVPLPLPARPVVHDFQSDEDDVLEFLDAIVAGDTEFDISDSDEYIEGCVKDLDKRILAKLRRGEFAVQAHKDLHRLKRDEARAAIESFVRDSRRRGFRCVLMVHGKGMHSKDNIPVLKESIKNWLSRGALSSQVLAFSSARQVDGGVGAVYVLLRK